MYVVCFICGSTVDASFDQFVTCGVACEAKFRELSHHIRANPQKKKKHRQTKGGAALATLSRDWRQMTFQEYEIDQLPDKKPRKKKGGKS